MGEDNKGKSLYAEYQKVYPRKVSGLFRRMKWALLCVLLAVYYLTPFLRWDRGEGMPDQAILIDMAGRRAYFFFIEIWPQEVYYLTGILILSAVGLFMVTAMLGRVWCGFACPQTIWTDLYLQVERWVEGDRNARIKLDKQPWTANKLSRKVIKHLIWLLIAVLTGGAWVLYFTDAPTLIVDLFTGRASTLTYVFIGIFTASTYLLAGWAREQVCIYMCPWPRIQGGMLDEQSLIVTYEAWRGEPRGSIKKGESFENRGHCIDCSLCVQVCPTGIDIRNGPQLGCIGCALCIDACNSVMEKIGLPRWLITYDSAVNQTARSKGLPTKIRLIRPRTLVYAAVLLLVSSIMLYGLTHRTTTNLTILPERNPLFVQQTDGTIRNGFTVKISNMENEERTFSLVLEGIDNAQMTVIGQPEHRVTKTTLTAKSDTVSAYTVFVTIPKSNVPQRFQDLTFVLTDQANQSVTRTVATFAAPGPGQ